MECKVFPGNSGKFSPPVYVCYVCETEIFTDEIYSCYDCKAYFHKKCYCEEFYEGGGQDTDVYFCCPSCEKERDKKSWERVNNEELISFLLKKCKMDLISAKMLCTKKKKLLF